MSVCGPVRAGHNQSLVAEKSLRAGRAVFGVFVNIDWEGH